MDFRRGDLGWCAVQVRPRYEVPVAAALRAKGYTEFLPMYRTRRQWSDRSKEIEVPIFTGYVFCKFNTEVPWAIVSTRGVIRIVGTRKEIAFIDDREMEAIRIVAASGKKLETCTYAGIGDWVRITNGILAGVEGRVIAYKNQQRLVLSVELIQSSIFVEVDCSMVLSRKSEAASSHDDNWSIPLEQLSQSAEFECGDVRTKRRYKETVSCKPC